MNHSIVVSPATRAVHNHMSVQTLDTPPYPLFGPSPYAAMVTSTSTPASMLMMICLTTSVGALRSMRPAKSLAMLPRNTQSSPALSPALLHYSSRIANIGGLTLVDAHLKGVPGLGTLTARGLAGGDLEALGGQTDGALDAKFLVLRAVDDYMVGSQCMSHMQLVHRAFLRSWHTFSRDLTLREVNVYINTLGSSLLSYKI
jgi:hypothetical protein